MKKHSVSIRGHSTSFSLEEPFWQELKRTAQERQISVASLVTHIDTRRKEDENLSSALRLFVLSQLQQRLNKINQSVDND